MTVSMTNWNKEYVQLRVKGNLLGRYSKVMFDDVEVGRIRSALPKNTNSTCKESYTISAAPYGAQSSSLLPFPPSAIVDRTFTVDVVLMVVISLCLNDRSYED